MGTFSGELILFWNHCVPFYGGYPNRENVLSIALGDGKIFPSKFPLFCRHAILYREVSLRTAYNSVIILNGRK